MKNNIYKYSYLLILIIISYQILTHSSIVIESVTYAINIWKNNLVPPMFAFFVLSELLINYGFVELIGYLFYKPFNMLFKINENGIFVIVMSILSGFPSSAKYIRELYIQNKISLKEANRLILFTHFSNPLFVLETIGITLFNNKKIGLLILLSHYLGNFIIGLIVRNKSNTNLTKDKKLYITVKESNPILVLTKAINNSINTLLLILGIITTCMIITNILNNHLQNNFLTFIINCIFEMTKGINNLNSINISILEKGVLAAMIISFGGISVHMQIASILSDTKIKYMPFLIARIFHSLISGLIFFILFNVTY